MSLDNLTRRSFIGQSFLLGTMGSASLLMADPQLSLKGKPRLRFGVVSDVHLYPNHNHETFRRALEYFRASGVDAVMICGDLTHYGFVSDLEDLAKDWQAVFPDNRAPDGRYVEKVFVTGNHEWNGHLHNNIGKKKYPNEADRVKAILQTDLKGAWESIFDEPFEPVYMKEVKGYKFVGAHWVKEEFDSWNENFWNVDFNDHIKDFYEKHAKDFDPKLPFFHVQHPHLKNTCYGAKAWGHDNGIATQMLSAHHNAIAFSGHSHYSLTDERSIWQGSFTSIGASSLCYSAVPNFHSDPGYENYSGFDDGKIMPRLSTFDGRQGMLVSVYDDVVIVSRREFMTNQPLGNDWVIPLMAESKPFEYAKRAKSQVAPRFEVGAKVKIEKGRAMSRGSRKVPKSEKNVYIVTFPAALSTAKTRAFDYEITFIGKDGKRKIRRLVSPGFHQPVGHKRATEDVKGLFAAESLPTVPFKVEVRACSCFGKASSAIRGFLNK